MYIQLKIMENLHLTNLFAFTILMRHSLQFLFICLITLSSSLTFSQTRSRQFNVSPHSIEATTPECDQEAARRMLVFESLAHDVPWSHQALTHAGIIFQHTNTEFEPDDGEEFRSQEMHLLAFFLFKEAHRLKGGTLPTPFLGVDRYVRVMGLPKDLVARFNQDPVSKKWVAAPEQLSDLERLRQGFPFALLSAQQTENANPLPSQLRLVLRDDEIADLYVADQQTRSLFKKDDMIYNRYIERVSDAQRRARLYELMSQDVMWDAQTLMRGASILNATKSILSSNDSSKFQLQENHLMAYFLARQAFLKGEQNAAPLVVESLNQYLKASKMPPAFGLQLSDTKPPRICQQDAHVSIEQWGKYEFPFHLGRSVKALCSRN